MCWIPVRPRGHSGGIQRSVYSVRVSLSVIPLIDHEDEPAMGCLVLIIYIQQARPA